MPVKAFSKVMYSGNRPFQTAEINDNIITCRPASALHFAEAIQ